MPAFLFHGEDTFSHKKKLHFWRNEFEKKHGGDMNISIFPGDKTSANEIFQACSSVPFLAEKRLIIVKNFLSEAKSEEQSGLSELIEDVPDFCVLVFSETGEVDKRMSLYKKLAKVGTLVDFPAMTGSKLLGWIEKEITAQGGAIEREALLTLGEIVGPNLYRLENEIAKLVAYTNGSRAITKSDIELMVESALATSIFKLTDGMGQKNARLALGTLHKLIETGEDLHRVFYMIMRQFRLITSVKDLAAQGLRKDEMISQLKEHPFVISNTLTQSGNFSFAQLKHVYELLLSFDTKVKTGGIKTLAGDNRELVLALDRLVLELCN